LPGTTGIARSEIGVSILKALGLFFLALIVFGGAYIGVKRTIIAADRAPVDGESKQEG
jgi:hypothetical protein